ncbi:hypothetical protein JB92DRAFT_3104005 [Gautieria morchelliformis]|nr:hypothetical protein JB92DRAFT_3104005 [Gautieria morchelliformis]
MDVTSISLPPPPLQLGDLRELGFSNITPVGAVQAALEFIQECGVKRWPGSAQEQQFGDKDAQYTVALAIMARSRSTPTRQQLGKAQ